MVIARRKFLKGLGSGALVTAGLLTNGRPARAVDSRVSGAGAYAVGPFLPLNEDDGEVFLTADMGFDETMVFCKVTTNFAPFQYPTFRLGTIDFMAHEFFMDMQSTSIDSLEITEDENGPVANYTGVLRSETRVFRGVRQQQYIEEHVTFGCETRQMPGGANIQISENDFSMTAYFDPTREHATIFGPEATFSGRLTRGNIVIIPG